jgi:tetraacyldisaccharide 4'-kinase
LSILTAAYGHVATLRRSWYERHPSARRRLARPVISVGNLSVGGSGKTPVVAALARLLRDAGERPSILSRGYGRRIDDPGAVVVSDGERTHAGVERAGDEPYLLARALPGVPVVVAADRYLAGRIAEARFGATVHLLDDGFQHLPLWRDCDLLLVSPADVRDRPLPSGRLREPLASGRSAHALLVSGSAEDVVCVATAVPVSPLFTVTAHLSAPRLLHPFGTPGSVATGARVVAVAGIAHPERFRASLSSLGWDVVEWLTYRDHHWFSPRDVSRVREAARAHRADAVITTEKDAVRLEAQFSSGKSASLAADAAPWLYVPLDVSIEPDDVFSRWLTGRIAQARAGQDGVEGNVRGGAFVSAAAESSE